MRGAQRAPEMTRSGYLLRPGTLRRSEVIETDGERVIPLQVAPVRFEQELLEKPELRAPRVGESPTQSNRGPILIEDVVLYVGAEADHQLVVASQVWLADIHGFLDALKAPIELVKFRAEYYRFCITALLKAVNVPIERLEFVL